MKSTTYGYDYRMRLTNIITGSDAPYLQNVTLTYDDASNVKTVADASDSPETILYDYDELNRLKSMTIDGTPSASYVYNNIGNLTSKTEGASTLALNYTTALTCTGGVRNGPHAVTSVSGSQTVGITYDCNGSLKTANGQSYTFDEANRLKERPLTGGQRERYTYDATGGMVKAENTTTGAWTRYVDGIYEVASTGAITKHYMALGHEVAGRDTTGLYYVLSDHLGTATRVVNATGGDRYVGKYWAFGATRWSTGGSPTELLFTGQREEKDDAVGLGLYNYNARFYSTTLGRFMSADPLGGRGADPVTLNAYTYTRNNPLRWTDPSGECNPGIDCPGDVFRNNVERWCNARPQDCGGSSATVTPTPTPVPVTPSPSANTPTPCALPCDEDSFPPRSGGSSNPLDVFGNLIEALVDLIEADPVVIHYTVDGTSQQIKSEAERNRGLGPADRGDRIKATKDQADAAGFEYLGRKAVLVKELPNNTGYILQSRDGLRQYRLQQKANGQWEANYQQRSTNSGSFEDNYHVTITDIP